VATEAVRLTITKALKLSYKV